MLEGAVAAARTDGREEAAREEWSPQITIGTPVLIPENYVPDLGVRLGLHRRIAGLSDRREIDGFAAELIDRFGTLPAEVENLLEIIAIKRFCGESRRRKARNRSQGHRHLTARQPFREPRRSRPPDPTPAP
jgi:transcription-repair coupling factor (superfamily II helicase)